MTFLIVVISLALIFDFINGFHDSANSIATVVSTKVLSSLNAVLLAAIFNFIAFTVFPMKVATTIQKNVIDPEAVNLIVITAALVAAITWNLITWWWGLPSSSSHTLVGGLVGAALVSSGPGAIIAGGYGHVIYNFDYCYKHC
jgi:Phosphate/sulphate permeases